jgi:hypothetical protein
MKYAFVIPEEIVSNPEDYDSYSDEVKVIFVPDIQTWIDEYLPNRTLLFYFDALEFAIEHEVSVGSSYWTVEFRSEADKLLFRLKWSDDPRFVKFREERAEQKRFMEELKSWRKKTLGEWQ